MIFHPTKNNNSAIIGRTPGRQRSTDRIHFADGDHFAGGMNNIVVVMARSRVHVRTWSRSPAVCWWLAFRSFAGPSVLARTTVAASSHHTRPGERRDRSFTRLASIMPTEAVCALADFSLLIYFCCFVSVPKRDLDAEAKNRRYGIPDIIHVWIICNPKPQGLIHETYTYIGFRCGSGRVLPFL